MEHEAPDEVFPPGTLRLERLLEAKHGETILHPTPTADPNDPLNWPGWYKVLNFSLVCLYTLMVFVNVDIGTVIWGDLNSELGISYDMLTTSFGVNLASLAVGSIIFIPFALKFGRRPIYLLSIAASMASAIWQARIMNAGDLLGTMVVSGLAGSLSEVICQMTIADIFFVHQRARANAIYLLWVSIGVFLGPVAAGYSAASQGWRWIFWWTTIIFAVSLLLFVFMYEETMYIPVVVGESSYKTRKPSATQSSGKADQMVDATMTVATPVDSTTGLGIQRKTYLQRLKLSSSAPGNGKIFAEHSYQPFVLLLTFPAVTYTAITYGALLCWFSVIVNVYSIYFTLPPYNFGPSGIGLMNLPPFIGTILGSLYGGVITDYLAIRLARRNGGIFEPEMRLWAALPAIVLLPASIILFGASTADGMPWIVPCIGSGLFGFAFITLGDVSLTYTMDCYKDVIGDALVGVCFIRNAFSAIVAMTLTKWIAWVGLKNMFIMCTVIAFVLAALTIPMMIWG